MSASGEFIFRISFNMHRLTHVKCVFIQMFILVYSNSGDLIMMSKSGGWALSREERAPLKGNSEEESNLGGFYPSLQKALSLLIKKGSFAHKGVKIPSYMLIYWILVFIIAKSPHTNYCLAQYLTHFYIYTHTISISIIELENKICSKRILYCRL